MLTVGLVPGLSIHVLQMVAARRAELHRQLRRARPRELLGVQPRPQSMPFALFKNALRLLPRKRTAIAEHITKFREFLARYFGNQLIEQEGNVLRCAICFAAIFSRYGMRSQKSRDDLQRLLRAQLPMQPENLQLARDIEPIPAFRLDRCRPICRELFQCMVRPLLQGLRGSGAQSLH